MERGSSVARPPPRPRHHLEPVSRRRRRGRLGRGLRASRRRWRAARGSLSLPRLAHGRRDGAPLLRRIARSDLCDDRHPVPADQHALPAARRLPRDAGDRGARADAADDSRFLQLPADRPSLHRIHHRHDDAVRRCKDEDLGGAAAGRCGAAGTIVRANRRPWHRDRIGQRRRITVAVGYAGGGHGVSRYGVRGGRHPRRRQHGIPELRHVVAARHGAAGAASDAGGARPQFHERRRRVRHDPPAEEHRRVLAAPGMPSIVAGGGAAPLVRGAARRGRGRAARVPVADRSGPRAVRQP